MTDPVLIVHGPDAAAVPLVLDSPHSGFSMPADFGSVCTEAELREGEGQLHTATLQKTAGFGELQGHLMALVDGILTEFGGSR